AAVSAIYVEVGSAASIDGLIACPDEDSIDAARSADRAGVRALVDDRSYIVRGQPCLPLRRSVREARWRRKVSRSLDAKQLCYSGEVKGRSVGEQEVLDAGIGAEVVVLDRKRLTAGDDPD